MKIRHCAATEIVRIPLLPLLVPEQEPKMSPFVEQTYTLRTQKPLVLESNPFFRDIAFAAENPRARDYLIDQARTTLIEAVWPGISTYSLEWNGAECSAPGLGNIRNTLRNGHTLAKEMGSRYEVEAQRRLRELQEYEALVMLLQNNAFAEGGYAMTLSPPVHDVMENPQIRKELGYQDNLGKVRIYMAQGNSVIAHEFFVKKNMQWWQQFGAEIGIQADNSTDLMQLRLITASGSQSEMISEIIERVYGDESGTVQQKSRDIFAIATPIAEEIADFDIAMGEMIREGRISPTEAAKRKEKLLMESITKLSAFSGEGRFGYLRPTANNINWYEFMQMLPPIEQIACGMRMRNTNDPYYFPQQLSYFEYKSFVFPGERKLVTCPCGRDVAISDRKAAKITCPHCSRSVEYGEMYKCASRADDGRAAEVTYSD